MYQVEPRIAERFSSGRERPPQARLRGAVVDESYRDHDTVITVLKAEDTAGNAAERRRRRRRIAQRKARRRLAASAAAAMIAACLEGLLLAPQATAGELGHYVPGAPLIRDFILPPPGFYYEQYNVFYTTDTFKDGDGNKVSSIEVGGETVDLDVDVDVFAIVPAFLYVTEWEVFGASYGFLAAPYFGNTSVAASLESETEFGLGVDDDQFGIGDLYLRPVWLGWHLGQLEVAASYGVYVPIGRYDADDVDNIGLGMWTHEFQLAGAYYFDERQTTVLTTAATYEVHHNKEGVDIRPGSHFTANFGLSRYVPLTQDLLGEIGVTGFGQWQVTDDSGSDAANKTVRDQIFGIGFQAGLTFLPYKSALVFRYLHEFAAEDRFEGDLFTLTLMKSF